MLERFPSETQKRYDLELKSHFYANCRHGRTIMMCVSYSTQYSAHYKWSSKINEADARFQPDRVWLSGKNALKWSAKWA